ncbi:MAG: transcriptional regulator, Crp/Fnr family [Clostridiales bacterium]|nr:transcriptional regulator, Crp/Fnr family [Clostridiales bacterium]
MECNHCSNEKNASEKTCIERVPIFSSLDTKEMMEIARITINKDYKKGETIYLAGDKGERLYVIHHGKVKISRISEAGKEQIIRILGDGDFMGELALFIHSPLNSTAEALEATNVCVIDGIKLNNIISNNPSISVKIIQELSNRLQNAENLIESIGLHDVEQRVADTLLNLVNDKNEIELTISKKDLAAHIGVSQETLSRRLTIFQDMGLIKQIGHRKILILDREGLGARLVTSDKLY